MLTGEASAQLWFEMLSQSAEYKITLGLVPYAIYIAQQIFEPIQKAGSHFMMRKLVGLSLEE